jgi:hypothetical protein
MNERLKEFMDSVAGKVTAGILMVAVVGMVYWSARSSFGSSDASRMASDRVFVCSKTGKSFWHTLEKGEKLPIYSKYSGDKTGYPAEMCFWNADGSIRREGVPVLLNQYKGDGEPTFCPDCGRLVVGHNPAADPSRKPPPTKAEFQSRKGNKELLNNNTDR